MLGRKAGAIEMFDKALALNPKYVPSLYHLGLMYHSEGQHEQAAQMFSAVIRLVPQVSCHVHTHTHALTVRGRAGRCKAWTGFGWAS